MSIQKNERKVSFFSFSFVTFCFYSEGGEVVGKKNMESVDGSDVNSDDEIFEKLSIDEEDDNTDIVDEDKKRKSKTKTKKKKGRNVYTPPHVRRIRSAQDRINELSYVKLVRIFVIFFFFFFVHIIRM